MPVQVRILAASNSLAQHEQAIQQNEALGFELLSIATGSASSAPANLITFTSVASAPASPVSLQAVAGNLTDQQQQSQLNGSGKSVVCYGSLFVNGQSQNVAALR